MIYLTLEFVLLLNASKDRRGNISIRCSLSKCSRNQTNSLKLFNITFMSPGYAASLSPPQSTPSQLPSSVLYQWTQQVLTEAKCRAWENRAVLTSWTSSHSLYECCMCCLCKVRPWSYQDNQGEGHFPSASLSRPREAAAAGHAPRTGLDSSSHTLIQSRHLGPLCP